MRPLQKRATDSLVEQLMARIGRARIVGPNAPLHVSDERYVGRLKDLLLQAYPGTPIEAFASVRDDLIVLARAQETRSELAHFEPSVLRVPNGDADTLRRWGAEFGALLNCTIQKGRHLETDLKGPSLTFHEQFFSPRSLEGWAALTLRLARACQAFVDLKVLSGLKSKSIFHTDRDTHLVHATFARTRHGESVPLELAPPS